MNEGKKRKKEMKEKKEEGKGDGRLWPVVAGGGRSWPERWPKKYVEGCKCSTKWIFGVLQKEFRRAKL